MTSPKIGTVTKIGTDPRGFTCGGTPFPPPITDDQWALIVAAWASGKELKVHFSGDPDGDPPTVALVVRVETA